MCDRSTKCSCAFSTGGSDFRSGERYPIMTSSYTALQAVLLPRLPRLHRSNTKIWSDLKVKPHIEGENEVSLDLNLKVESLAGSTINDILRLRAGSTQVSSRCGSEKARWLPAPCQKRIHWQSPEIPGLSEIPGLHNATDRQDTTDSLDLVILVTPHIVRLTHRERPAQCCFCHFTEFSRIGRRRMVLRYKSLTFLYKRNR